MKKDDRGITLIALVITIIVLLILAGVSIATLTGPNGLLTRANEAKKETAIAGAKERVLMETAASYDNNGNFNMDKLKENLKTNLGLQDSDITDNGDGSITVTVDGYEVTVDSNGNVTVEGEATTPEEPEEPMIPDDPTATKTPPITPVGEDTKYQDANSGNKIAVIPKGFKVSEVVSEQKIDTGLVVIAPDGSEFVWVPVDKETLEVDGIKGKEVAEMSDETNYRGVLYNGFDQITSTKIPYDEEGYREPAYLTDSTVADANPTYNTIGLTPTTVQDEYNAIINSIKTKGGFYVGRYESSLSGSTKTEVATTGNIQSKRDVMPTSTDNSGTYRWYGLYAKQKEYATVINSRYQTNVKSAMIYGSMYDAILNWALYGTDRTDAGKVTETNIIPHGPDYAGALPEDEIKNIYDLANNFFELTAEANLNKNRVGRGGFYDYNASPSARTVGNPYYTDSTVGSRLLLY